MVGLGDTKKKLQTMIDAAEELYAKMNELRAEVDEMREKLDATSETVRQLDREVDEQRAILEALAAEQGVDVDAVLADASIEEAAPEAESDETTDAAGGTAAEPEE